MHSEVSVAIRPRPRARCLQPPGAWGSRVYLCPAGVDSRPGRGGGLPCVIDSFTLASISCWDMACGLMVDSVTRCTPRSCKSSSSPACRHQWQLCAEDARVHATLVNVIQSPRATARRWERPRAPPACSSTSPALVAVRAPYAC